MKLILAQPANGRFEWELEVLLTNLRQLDHFNLEVVLLFTEQDYMVPPLFRRKYPEVSVHVYEDHRTERRYLSTVRPYLWQQYLKEDLSRQDEDYLYIDSDVIFREWLDLSNLPEGVWLASPCLQKGGMGYVDYEYIIGCENGREIALRMAEICGITLKQLMAAPSVGAQWIMRKPTLAYWERVQRDCDELYQYFEQLGPKTNIQAWICDMWAHLFGAIREGKIVLANPDMAFCVATDPVEKYDQVKILHNAGVLSEHSNDMFFKGQYRINSPLGKDFSNVRTDKATIKYVEALQKVLQ